MNKFTVLFLFSVILFSFQSAGSQELLSYKKVKTMTKQEISNSLFIPAKYDVDVYVIEYTSKKINLKKDTASGIIAVAKDPKFRFPTAVYNHGTVDNRNDVPSKGSNEQLFTIAIASYGYHCVAPDYIGLGISKGVHPYVNPESEAWATIDLIKACHTMSGTEPFYFNDQVFVTGYSQGGHAAMATAFAIEQRNIKGIDSMVLTAAVPMSGPYSISKEMKAFTLGDTPYNFCAYLGSAFLSAKLAHFDLLGQTQVEDVFETEYAQLIRKYESETIGLFAMNDQMVEKLKANGGKVLPKRMLKNGFYNDFISNPNNPLQLALTRMDVSDWVPLAPVTMIYCKSDDQVTYRNAVYTDSLMKKNGALKVSAIDVFSSGNHGSCFYPAILRMISIFNGLQRIDPLSTTGEITDNILIYPNPAQSIVNIDLGQSLSEHSLLEVIDMCGKSVFKDFIYSKNSIYSINVGSFKQGFYIIKLSHSSGRELTKKLVIN
ncbi:MAG: T9SS type A sorting domain-containing protein [Deltaproteobacteria bacterium]